MKFSHINITSNDSTLANKLRHLAEGITGPTYDSNTHGVIAIKEMAHTHRLNAAKKLLRGKLDELQEILTEAQTLSELSVVHESLILDDETETNVTNLIYT